MCNTYDVGFILTQHQPDLLFNGGLEFVATGSDMDEIGVGRCKFQFEFCRFIVLRTFYFGYAGRDDGSIGVCQCWFGLPIRVLEYDF